MYVCMYVCMYVFVYACMDICLCVRMFVFVYIYIYVSVCVLSVSVCVYVCVCICSVVFLLFFLFEYVMSYVVFVVRCVGPFCCVLILFSVINVLCLVFGVRRLRLQFAFGSFMFLISFRQFVIGRLIVCGFGLFSFDFLFCVLCVAFFI